MAKEFFAVRLSPGMVEDIDTISSVKNLNRSEWVRRALGEKIREEVLDLHPVHVQAAYHNGDVDKKQLEKVLGPKETEEILNGNKDPRPKATKEDGGEETHSLKGILSKIIGR